MGMATRLNQFLNEHQVEYEVLTHPHTASSMETAEAAHVPGDKLAKTVILEDDQGYVMAVLPASHKVDLGTLHRELNRPLGLASEPELDRLFSDCELGAIPPIGTAYGLETIVDDTLAEQPDLYFECGDHEHLVHMNGETFVNLLEGARITHFSRHV